MTYPVTVCGITIDLPARHSLRATRQGMTWRVRCIYDDLHLERRFADCERVRSHGSTMIVMVTAEEERAIRVATLHRERDAITSHAERVARQSAERLAMIDQQLHHLTARHPARHPDGE